MRNRKLINDITLDALFIAIIVIMTFVPQMGFLTIGIVSITFIHVPVIVGAAFLGWKRGLIYGTAFGIASWFRAFNAGTIVDPYFINPMISIFPRIVFGFVVGAFAHRYLNPHNEQVKNGVRLVPLAGIGTAYHTALVISILVAFHPEFSNWPFFSLVLINLAVEAGVAIFLGSILYNALYKPFMARQARFADVEGETDEL